MSRDPLTPSARAAVSRMEEELNQMGWRSSIVVTPRSVSIEVEHPLTAPTSFNFDNDDSDHSAFVERSLRHPEFATVARAPTASPHAPLMGHLRAAAASYNWGADVLPTVAHILGVNGALTEAESDWLAGASSAWGGDAAGA